MKSTIAYDEATKAWSVILWLDNEPVADIICVSQRHANVTRALMLGKIIN